MFRLDEGNWSKATLRKMALSWLVMVNQNHGLRTGPHHREPGNPAGSDCGATGNHWPIAKAYRGLRGSFEPTGLTWHAGNKPPTDQRPTQRTPHAVEVCPDCGPHLAGEWVHRIRGVIEIPLVPIEVTEHVFVAHPAVPADNNAAERSLRHLVTSRKISGGTRSQQGTNSKMALASLFGTWRATGLNPFLNCRQLLISPQA